SASAVISFSRRFSPPRKTHRLQPVVVQFDLEEDLQKVYTCLMENYFRRVPVTSNGKVVGIVSRRDVLDYVSHSDRERISEQESSEPMPAQVVEE
ncbi:MAG: CBS domain-containing protein, partial [Sedimentisphaerales bacterium]|nr:CBS domain-containing protein [Sedimentisphaerales bacterium]